MPFTPLHYPIAYVLSKFNKRLILPGLIVGSFIPDIEVPVLMICFRGILPDHLLLHSLVGALTLGTLLSVLVTVYIYPSIIACVFRINRIELNGICKPSAALIISCLFGNLFHLLLDVTMHISNPIFWPWLGPENVIGPLVILFSGETSLDQGFLVANISSNLIMGIFGLIILVYKRRSGWESLLVGNTCEHPEAR